MIAQHKRFPSMYTVNLKTPVTTPIKPCPVLRREGDYRRPSFRLLSRRSGRIPASPYPPLR